MDLPGVYSLLAASPEEAIARDEILSGSAGVVIQVLDATNLERNLHLTAQLTEMGVPLVYALNMSDEAEAHGLKFDLEPGFNPAVVDALRRRGHEISVITGRQYGRGQIIARAGEGESWVGATEPRADGSVIGF